jgi:hypothetical protein
VNAITGTPKNIITPPSNEQDYVVAGLQPWLDGIMTEPGVVRQVCDNATNINAIIAQSI